MELPSVSLSANRISEVPLIRHSWFIDSPSALAGPLAASAAVRFRISTRFGVQRS